MPNRFVDENDLRQIDLGDGDWVKISREFSYGLMEEVSSIKNESEKNVALMAKIIREWNLTDKDGKAVGITSESIRRLNIETIGKIAEVVKDLVGNEKKVSTG